MRQTLAEERLERLARAWGTPLYVYDLEVVRRQVAALSAFDVVRYAQKANSNLTLLRELRLLGAQVDAVSAGELRRALLAGFPAQQVHYTADVFDEAALELLREVPAHANFGSMDMIEQFADIGLQRQVTLRVNPGFGHGHDRKVSTGGRASKHGIWFDQIPEAVERCRGGGLTVTGVHMHIGSGSDFDHLSRIRSSMEKAVLAAGPDVTTISTGGGLPVPYRPEEKPFDVDAYAGDWLATRDALSERLGRRVTLEVEPGRFLVAEAGLLLAEVRALKAQDDLEYVVVDAGFDCLIRPAMYGAYHHVSALGGSCEQTARVVAGPLCESADMFTQSKGGLVDPRPLGQVAVGDLVCVHGAGAYASSMASNYNSRLLAAEVLVDGSRELLIRKRQTFEQLIDNELEGLRSAEAAKVAP
ncbi:MAG: diaminopimelate decarboxylase [Acidobacteriota bacterium]